MEDNFQIRAYSFGELAQLYFPNITKKSATKQLTRWLTLNENLYRKLSEMGYQKCIRILTPSQVKIIIEVLGEP